MSFTATTTVGNAFLKNRCRMARSKVRTSIEYSILFSSSLFSIYCQILFPETFENEVKKLLLLEWNFQLLGYINSSSTIRNYFITVNKQTDKNREFMEAIVTFPIKFFLKIYFSNLLVFIFLSSPFSFSIFLFFSSFLFLSPIFLQSSFSLLSSPFQPTLSPGIHLLHIFHKQFWTPQIMQTLPITPP